ncbi:glycine betaine/proline transport system permease protein [Gemmobacter caeni]|uniref:Glycine betaine/proline transport system permease protein n=1 Tax=Gemmobacter caeni TaxID=589035 RepID=A0A2T6ATC6_9RHOB|nr:ABC transporter permease subunit [Gemmobacter caeni]PTX47063.1 glycine betaine/proline transport system permease protein [Gemmobacter caeni]TWI96080.1 glycine betaine/proline transport system permease protein [Gemmobacter caeni]
MRRWRPADLLFWGGLALVTLVLSLASKQIGAATGWKWLTKFPKGWELHADRAISTAMKWLVEDAALGPLRFRDLTRLLSALVEAPYFVLRDFLIDGFQIGQGQQAVPVLPHVSWLVVVLGFGLLAHRAGGFRLAALVVASFLYLLLFGLWESAMVTLASVAIAVPLGVGLGILLGIAAFRFRWVDTGLRPLLDLMQTVPVFAYLVPILFLFGFGAMSALVATIIYAMPPMVRITTLGLRGVPEEIVEAGRMSGCTPRQNLWKVRLPAARGLLMVGVNQVIMLTLNMVIIASMIGAGGLGFQVLTALRKLDVGAGVEAGFGIVILAVALDRLSQAIARRGPVVQAQGGWMARHPRSLALLVVLLVSYPLGVLLPALNSFPESWQLSTGSFWQGVISWINLNLYDQIEAVKVFALTWILVPVKQLLLGIPWPWGLALAFAIPAKIGGWRLGAMGLAMASFIAASGLWPEAMITLYLCGVSVVIAMLIGVPLGVWAGQNARANTVLTLVIDTLQTLPTFVYLIPVVMLFRVGDFSAMIAVVLYAVVPAVRYAAHGIRSIDSQLVEAGLVSGCTPRQLLWKVKLPLAMPSILLGLNQTIMLALSMLVITALVGTRDLGQEVYIALTKANVGKGVVAGLAVAFLAIMSDRIITAAVNRKRGEDHA